MTAVRAGDVEVVQRLLIGRPELATARLDDGSSTRSLLHVATDRPGPLPRVAETIAVLVAAGTPLSGARAFRCWAAAARLVERGAHVDLHDAATLGIDGLPPGSR